MYAKDLTGKEVVGLNGYKIGKSKEIVFDRDSWKITHIDVELKGNIETELGMPSGIISHNHLPIDVTTIQGIADVITLKTTKEDLVGDITAYSKIQRPTSLGEM
ncbi:MAG: PRC-barrel domain-containing protein [Nitrososphaerales archaeon]